MERKRLILRLARVAILLIILSGAVNIFELIHTTLLDRRLIYKKNNHLEELTKECQKFLDETAAKITGLSVDQHLISQIKSEIFKKSPDTNLYLWMSSASGEFVFGIPSPLFNRLNKTFDRNQKSIEQDGYFLDRNDFLLQLVNRREITELTRFDSGDQRLIPAKDWLYYIKSSPRPESSIILRLTLSSPIVNEEKQMVGELYLSVVDNTYRRLYYRYKGDNFLNTILFPAFHVILGFSLVFLWILLPSWVYIDARQRDVRRAGLWALLTVISFGFAWLVYLITRPTALKAFHCPQCDRELNGTKAFCPYCGFDLSSTFCPQCQYQVKADWQFCPNCRFNLTQKPQEVKEEKGAKS